MICFPIGILKSLYTIGFAIAVGSENYTSIRRKMVKLVSGRDEE